MSSNTALIVNYDIFGLNMGRTRGVCDQLSKSTGFHVVMPDYFRNADSIVNHGGIPLTENGREWLKTYPSSSILADTDSVIYFMENLNITKFGSVGLCWGAWAGFHQASRNYGQPSKILAHTSAHPSLYVEEFFGGTVEDLVRSVTSPVQLLPAGNDLDDFKDSGSVVDWLKNEGNFVDVFEFEEMVHGWVPRGNVSDGAVARDVQSVLHNLAGVETCFLKLSEEPE